MHKINFMLQNTTSVVSTFNVLGDVELFCLMLIHPNMIRVFVKTCIDILRKMICTVKS